MYIYNSKFIQIYRSSCGHLNYYAFLMNIQNFVSTNYYLKSVCILRSINNTQKLHI